MSTALYRRYRPETFADVIGQEHVTDPLRAALRADRITHAYLFSGPRGCGKTTSARIFARCLNCAEGPTDTPCGTCPSCVELARDGAGSLDVVEMDAASHGGVDDARELRERAAFAPARDRYKIFIIDEAHMVTSQGFNALLKLVEEPPAHVKFVFATTEPEKVIGTIRSRTHHYPFRLVPPERLQGYLEELCAAEGVSVATGVLPLVVRAGGGSVRDSLSVLDQLIAGAQDGEVGYERAVSLLGYTHATLLDDVVDALAGRDGASLFRVVDRVIDSGHDPRRFAEDLLERIRDLVVIAVSGEHAAAVLRSLPKDQFERMRVQSQQLGPAELSRAGDLVNDALTEMSGATSPRLQLELMCARLLLPGADDATRGHAARLDRIERRLSAGGTVPAAQTAGASAPAPAAAAPAAPAERRAAHGSPTEPPVRKTAPGASGERQAAHDSPTETPAAAQESGSARPVPASPGEPRAAREVPAGTSEGERPGAAAPASAQDGGSPSGAAPHAPARAEHAGATPQGAAEHTEQEGVERASREDAGARTPSQPGPTADSPARPRAAGEAPEPQPGVPSAWERRAEASAAPSGTPAQPAAPSDATAQPAAQGGPDADLVRRRWPEVLSTLAGFKRTTWTLVSQNAHVGEVSGGVLHLAFATGGLAHTFRTGTHAEALQRALLETLGVQLRIEAVLSQAAEGGDQGGVPYASGGWDGAPSSAPATDVSWSSGEPRVETAEGGVTPPASPSQPSRPGPSHTGPTSPGTTGSSPGAAERSAPTPADAGPHVGAAASPAPSPADAGPHSPPGPGPSAPSPEDPGQAPSSPAQAGRGQPAPGAPERGGSPWRQDAGPGDAAAPGSRPAGTPASAATPSSTAPVARISLADDTPSMDDPDAENSGLVGAPLIQRMLGGTIISED